MLGWLSEKGENARVRMCVKEIKWTLEQADEHRRAIILLLAQRNRFGLTVQGGCPPSFFDRPLDHSRAELVQVYVVLENSRNKATWEREQITKAMKPFGGWPAFALEHSMNVNRGMEVWMCTVGSGIVPGVHNDVRQIWSMLSNALPYTPDAIQSIQETFELTEQRLGRSDLPQMLAELPVPEWLALSDYVPSAFRCGLQR